MPGQTLEMYLIGRSVLVLKLNLRLATDDVDFVDRMGAEDLERKAVELFGQNTSMAKAYGIYLQAVPQGLPPVPIGYGTHAQILPGEWRVLRPKLPDFHDLAVTKLKRFHSKDKEDLMILCNHSLLTEEGLQTSLDFAYYFAADEEEDPDRRRSYANLRKVMAYLRGQSRTL